MCIYNQWNLELSFLWARLQFEELPVCRLEGNSNLNLKTVICNLICNFITVQRLCIYICRTARAHVENVFIVHIRALAHCKTRCL
jgi:hypothetical protein